MKNLYKIEDELYVISKNEDISENCWIITSGKLVQVSYLLSDEVAKVFKVILTTNKLLIKDGVQAIDDEFLEWFCNNPSCEVVDVQKGFADGTGWGYNFLDYKIIIPKEEPLYDYGWCKGNVVLPKEEPKQERSYSEKDLKEAFYANEDTDIGEEYLTFTKWFEQFKKK